MLGVDRRLLQNFSWSLFGLVALLMAAGVGNLVSATLPFGGENVGISAEVRRQLLSMGLGGGLMLVVLLVDYRHFERLALPFYAICVLLLLLTLVVAPVTRGSQSWLMGGRIQPSEFAKLGIVLVLARYFHRNPAGEIRRLRDLIRPGLLALLPVGLIVAQRDLGVALLTLLIACSFLPFVRIPWKSWAVVAVIALAGLATLWTFGLEPYQRSRILDVIDPGRDPLASGYQVIQSRIAIGSGGLLGAGWTDGTQTQLRFLPTQHTDFIFSVLAEEWGFLGAGLVLTLYLVLLVWGLFVARNSKDGFGALLAVGVVGILFWPAAVNIAMVLGLAPVIGVPLPLFSYGGSAMVSSLVAIGLLLNVSMRRYVF